MRNAIFRLGAVLFAALFAVCAGRDAGLAAGFSATIAPANQNFGGPCPGTVHFSGTITGDPGQDITYQFVGSGYASGAVQSGTLSDPDGKLEVSENLSVDASNQGYFTRRLTAKSSGLSTTSTVANFSVTCGGAQPGATPSPAPPSGGKFIIHPVAAGVRHQSITQLVYGVPMPENLRSTTDPRVCSQHGGFAGLFCIQAVPDNYLILIWDWSANERWPAVDGYRVYDVTGGSRTLNQTVTNEQQTLEFFKPGTYGGRCYAVTAFKGSSESATSPSFCTAGAQIGLKHMTLQMPLIEMRQEAYLLGDLAPYDDCQAKSALCFGWLYEKEIHLGVVTSHYNVVHRVYMIWDRAPISGMNVAKATLTVNKIGGLTAGTENYVEGFGTCFGALGAASGPWLGTNNLTAADFSYPVPDSFGGNSATFDVTRIVQDWGAGRHVNYGFVFKGRSEDLGSDQENNTCEAYLDRNATLVIDYY